MRLIGASNGSASTRARRIRNAGRGFSPPIFAPPNRNVLSSCGFVEGVVMANLPKHVVRANEDLEKFAAANHYKNFKAIWNHPKNRDLRKKRRDPKNIQKGDVIVLP